MYREKEMKILAKYGRKEIKQEEHYEDTKEADS